MRVVWTVGAADDLSEIVNRIAQDDANAARRVAQRIFEEVKGLRAMPNRGRKRSADSSRELVALHRSL